MDIKSKDLLETYTQEYMPSAHSTQFFSIRNRALFTNMLIREMITDPRISYGLYLIKGPIVSNAKFEVECESAEIKEYLASSVERFWRNSASRALKSVEWGFSGSEVLYRIKDGRIHFDTLKDLDPHDVSPVRNKGELVGIYVRNNRDDRYSRTVSGQNATYLGGPKAFWHIHWRERSPWWGVSRLFGAHIPYWEKWSEGGYRDIRRLWYHKNAFQGGTMYHPPGTMRDDNNIVRSVKDIAREIVEKVRSGGVLTLPNMPAGDGGQRAWEFIPPMANATPEGLLEYGQAIDTEILEAMGIPPEVIESGGNQGFGSSTGRQVPQEAFYAILNELVQWLVTDFENQVLRPLVEVNFGKEYDFDIFPLPLGESPMEEMPNESTGENQYLDNEGDAKSQDEIDQEEGDRYEKSRSKTLKTFQMADSETSTTSGNWVTIGGRAVSGKKHVGGFPVKLSKDGTIIAGGPRSLHGKHVSDTKDFFNKDKRGERAKQNSGHRTPFHTKHNLPDPNTRLGQALKEYAGDDYEEQARFHDLVKEAHQEHKEKVQDFKLRYNSPDFNKKFYKGADISKAKESAEAVGLQYTPEMQKLVEDNADRVKDTRDLKRLFQSAASMRNKDVKGQSKTSDIDYVSKVLTKRESRNQEKSWSTVSKNLAETLDMDKGDVESAANDLYDRVYKSAKDREDVKATLRKLFGTNATKQTKAEDRDMEDSGIIASALEHLDKDVLVAAGFELESVDSYHGTTVAVAQSEHNASLARELVSEGKQRIPAKTDDEFLGMLFEELTGGDTEEREIDDPEILNAAAKRWHDLVAEGDTSFDFGF
jgi:hypothetical protein